MNPELQPETQGEAVRAALQCLALDIADLAPRRASIAVIRDLLLEVGDLAISIEDRIEQLDTEIIEEESDEVPDEATLAAMHAAYFDLAGVLDRMTEIFSPIDTETLT